MIKLWNLGMQASTLGVLRDSALCVFAFCMNGLRESSVTSIRSDLVEFQDGHVTVRLSVVKGKKASQEALVKYQQPWGT